MKITWLSHSGLLFESDKITILVDPYLSDSLSKTYPEKARRAPVMEKYFDVEPDVILLTHAHRDHLDPETLSRFLCEGRTQKTILASPAAYKKVQEFGGEHNYVMLDAHSVWSIQGITFYSVRAAHSEDGACGFIIDDGEKTYYIAGDTLYNYDVIDDVLDLVETGVDYAFLPINGRGCNMNAKDAADFAYEIGAHFAIPVHYGLIDAKYPTNPEEFDFEGAIILTPYEETEL